VSTSTRRRSRLDADSCARSDAALARAFQLLGKRWTGLVLGTLSGGPTGFRALTRAVEGISDSVLADRLAELTDAGLVIRTVDDGPPSRSRTNSPTPGVGCCRRWNRSAAGQRSFSPQLVGPS
jgi:DNA-binding HxlR family transcriptional regulator